MTDQYLSEDDINWKNLAKHYESEVECLKKELEQCKTHKHHSSGGALCCRICGAGMGGPECKWCRAGVFEGSRREKERTKEVIDKTYEERLILSDYECTIVLNYLRKELGLGEEDEEDDEVERT